MNFKFNTSMHNSTFLRFTAIPIFRASLQGPQKSAQAKNLMVKIIADRSDSEHSFTF